MLQSKSCKGLSLKAFPGEVYPRVLKKLRSRPVNSRVWGVTWCPRNEEWKCDEFFWRPSEGFGEQIRIGCWVEPCSRAEWQLRGRYKKGVTGASWREESCLRNLVEVFPGARGHVISWCRECHVMTWIMSLASLEKGLSWNSWRAVREGLFSGLMIS